MSGDPNANGADHPAPGPSSDGKGGRALPPPAFPPGARRTVSAPRTRGSEDLSGALILPDEPLPERDGEVPADAFISPDDPFGPRGWQGDPGAFISPDEPIRQRPPRSAALLPEGVDADDGVVTGMGDDAHLDPEELAMGFDPHVLDVVDKVAKLAEALKRKGEAGLRTTPDMSRFEATLRSYCVGYLAGRRAEDEKG